MKKENKKIKIITTILFLIVLGVIIIKNITTAKGVFYGNCREKGGCLPPHCAVDCCDSGCYGKTTKPAATTTPRPAATTTPRQTTSKTTTHPPRTINPPTSQTTSPPWATTRPYKPTTRYPGYPDPDPYPRDPTTKPRCKECFEIIDIKSCNEKGADKVDEFIDNYNCDKDQMLNPDNGKCHYCHKREVYR